MSFCRKGNGISEVLDKIPLTRIYCSPVADCTITRFNPMNVCFQFHSTWWNVNLQSLQTFVGCGGTVGCLHGVSSTSWFPQLSVGHSWLQLAPIWCSVSLKHYCSCEWDTVLYQDDWIKSAKAATCSKFCSCKFSCGQKVIQRALLCYRLQIQATPIISVIQFTGVKLVGKKPNIIPVISYMYIIIYSMSRTNSVYITIKAIMPFRFFECRS